MSVNTSACAPRRRLLLVMRMHRAPEGHCWADSEHLPGYTAAGEDFRAVMDLVDEGIGNGMVFGALDVALVDLRWQWCETDRSVMAIRGTRYVDDQPREVCPCVIREGSVNLCSIPLCFVRDQEDR